MLKADSPPSPGDDRHSTVEPQVVHNDPSLRADGIPGTNLAAGASLFYHSGFQLDYVMEAIDDTLILGVRTCEVYG